MAADGERTLKVFYCYGQVAEPPTPYGQVPYGQGYGKRENTSKYVRYGIFTTVLTIVISLYTFVWPQSVLINIMLIFAMSIVGAIVEVVLNARRKRDRLW